MSLELRIEDSLVEHLEAQDFNVKVEVMRDEPKGDFIIDRAKRLGGLIVVTHTSGNPESLGEQQGDNYEVRLNFIITCFTTSRRGDKDGILLILDKVRRAIYDHSFEKSNFEYTGHDVSPTPTEEGIYIAEISYAITKMYPTDFIEQ